MKKHIDLIATIFDPEFYLDRYPDIKQAGIPPLVHYLASGGRELRSPHPLFDSEYYCSRTGQLPEGLTPLEHYLTEGWQKGLQPHPAFDSHRYFLIYPDIKKANVPPLLHYLTFGAKEGRSAHPLFDNDFYLQQCDENQIDFSSDDFNPLVHYLKTWSETGFDPHPKFNSRYYLAGNRDIADAGINPLVHFLSVGVFEQRSPNLQYPKGYMAENKRVVARELNPFVYWLEHSQEIDIPSFEDYIEWRFKKESFRWIFDDPRMKKRKILENDFQFLLMEIIRLGRKKEAEWGLSDKKRYVSIIVPAYNQLIHTLGCIRSVLITPSKYSYEIIVADDRSSDGTTKAIQGIENSIIKLRTTEKHQGFLKNCNAAAEYALCDFLIFLNNDAITLPHWLDGLMDTFKDEVNVGLAGSKLIYPDGMLQEAGSIIRQDGKGWKYGNGHAPSNPKFNFLRDTDYCSAASIALPTKLWQQLGGFDPKYAPAWYEDTDLAFRVREAGYRVIYQPFSEAIHFEGVSHGKEFGFGLKKYQEVNKHRFLNQWKHVLKRIDTIGQDMPSEIKSTQFIDCGLIKPLIIGDGLKGRHLRQTDNPLVSIIISAYNHWDITSDCIASITDNTDFDETPYEVILADDCSSDGTQYAQDIFPGIILVRTPKNIGYLRNNNNAAARARGKYIVLINNDTQVQKKWLSELVKTFDQHPNAGLVGSLLYTSEGLCMDSGNMIKSDGSGDCIGRGFNPDDPAYCYVRECHYVTAACMMVRRSLWEKIGGYDERYEPAYCEDADFGLEVWKHGYKVFIQPFSRVVHFENISYGNAARNHIEERTAKLYDKWENKLKNHPPDMNNIFLDKDLSADKKTIIVIEGWVPAWDTNAGARSFLMFILLKRELGYNVKLIFNHTYPDDYMDYIHKYQELGFEVWHPSISNIDWKEWLFRRRYAIDAVFVHRANVADIVFDWLKDTLQKPIIYFNHDLHFLRMQRELESGSEQHSPEEIALFRKKELKYLRESTVSSSPSLYEISILRNEFGIDDCKFMPLFVYDYIKNVPRAVNKSQNIIFVAGFNHKPNIHGCMWFMENVWNFVKDEVPEVKLHIVGSEAGTEILQLNELDGVTVHGFVSDERLNSLYSETRLSVIPLLSGAGLKGKLLEALHNQIPVVGTSMAFEGCPDIEKVCKPCNTPLAFAKDIILLLKDDNECERRSKTGLDLINKHFSKDAGLSTMQNIVETAIGDNFPDREERRIALNSDKENTLRLNFFDIDSFTQENPHLFVTGMHPEYYYYFFSKHKTLFMQKHAMVISPVSTEFGQGNSILTKVLTSKLKDMDYIVHFIYCPTDESDALDNGKDMPWDFIYTLEDSKQKLLKLKMDSRGVPLPNAHLVDDWFTDELHDKVIEISYKYKIDVCLCNYIWLSKALELLPATTVKVLETHDVFSYRDTDKNMLVEQSHSGWYSTIPEEERRGLLRADHILAVKEEDGKFFSTLVDNCRVSVAGCTLPENYLQLKPLQGKMVIGYIAGVNALNIDQVQKLYCAWINRPELYQNTELYIAGSLGVWLQKHNLLAEARVEGFINNVSDFYRKCHIIINPDFGGTGIKIKCIEALSYGKPLIASERSMNGIDSDSPYHKANDMEHLLDLIEKLYSDVEEYRRLAGKSREVYRNYVSKNDFTMLLKDWCYKLSLTT